MACFPRNLIAIDNLKLVFTFYDNVNGDPEFVFQRFEVIARYVNSSRLIRKISSGVSRESIARSRNI